MSNSCEDSIAAGGCHCGQIRYAVTGAPLRHSICHCADCRRHSGAPCVAWAIFPRERFRIVRGEPILYASSDQARRHFCGACGTGLFYTSDAIFPSKIDVQSATMDDPNLFAPTENIQTAERVGWLRDAHLLPQHARYPDDGD